MAETITIQTSSAMEVVKIVDLGPQGPQGERGVQGEAGPSGSPGSAATVSVGTVTTGAAGSSASVTNTGTSSAAVLAFTIPRGDKGDKGDTGSTGPAGTTDYNALTNKPTLGTAASKDVAATGNATSGQVVLGSDTRLSDTRTPTDGSVTDAKITSGGLSTSSLNWAAIADWQPSTAYAKGDLVNYLGVAYRRSAAGTSGTTFSSANWQQITPSTGTSSSTLAVGNHTHTSFPSLRIDPNDGSVGSLTVGSTTGSQTDVVKLNSTGVVLLNQSGNGATTIGRGGGSSNYTLTPPTASGTIALTSDIPTTFAASAITSGTLDNARINWAAPGSIGSTTAASGAFTTLNASTSLTLGTSGILSGGTNLIEQRNGTSGQAFRIYNTVSGTADANYERGKFAWESNVLRIGTEKSGTGSARALELQTDGTTRMTIPTSGYIRVQAGLGFGTSGGWDIQCGNNLEMTGAGGAIFWTNGPAIVRDANHTFALRSGTNAQTYRLYNTFSSTTSFERLNIRWASNECIIDAEAGSGGGTLRGIKIGSATSSLLGFYGATPAAQPTAVADATDAASVITQLNALLSRMRTIGLIAT